MQTCSLINILTSWDILTIKASRMYRMPEKQSWSRMVLNCTRSCFCQYANHLPCHSFSIKLKYPDFFYHFSICFVSFYIILCKLSSFMRIYAFKRKKNLEETLCLQPRQFASVSLHLHFYANYCSSAGFRWRQKCRFWIPRCLPFWAPFLFWLSIFYKLSFRLFIPTF